MVARRRRKPVRNRRKTPHRFDWQVLQAAVKPIATLSLLMLVGVASWRGYEWLTLPSTLPVRHVEMRGDLQRVDMKRLRRQVNTAVKGGFFSIDLESARNGLESLPWVYGASLRRIWPDRLIIEIEAQKPIVRWGDKGMLNQYGDVFKAALDPSLPQILGEDGREKQLISDFIEVERALKPLDLRLLGLREDARRDQRLTLNNGIELALGRKNRQARLSRFVTSYPQTLAPLLPRISALDLRYANGFAVRWKEKENTAKFTKTRDDKV